MKKQLMWTSATLKQEDINFIKKICIDNTNDLRLSDRFFRFPLHISLKRTYYVGFKYYRYTSPLVVYRRYPHNMYTPRTRYTVFNLPVVYILLIQQFKIRSYPQFFFGFLSAKKIMDNFNFIFR